MPSKAKRSPQSSWYMGTAAVIFPTPNGSQGAWNRLSWVDRSPTQTSFQATVFVMVCCIEGSWWTWNVLVAVCWVALEHSSNYSALRTKDYQQRAIGTDTLHRMLRCPTLPGLQKFKKCLVLTNSRQGICFAERCGCSSAGLGKR